MTILKLQLLEILRLIKENENLSSSKLGLEQRTRNREDAIERLEITLDKIK